MSTRTSSLPCLYTVRAYYSRPHECVKISVHHLDIPLDCSEALPNVACCSEWQRLSAPPDQASLPIVRLLLLSVHLPSSQQVYMRRRDVLITDERVSALARALCHLTLVVSVHIPQALARALLSCEHRSCAVLSKDSRHDCDFGDPCYVYRRCLCLCLRAAATRCGPRTRALLMTPVFRAVSIVQDTERNC